jgi:hypothetical protein
VEVPVDGDAGGETAIAWRRGIWWEPEASQAGRLERRERNEHIEMVEWEQEVCSSHHLTSSSPGHPAHLFALSHRLLSVRLGLLRGIRRGFLNEVRRVVGNRVRVRGGGDRGWLGKLAKEEPWRKERRLSDGEERSEGEDGTDQLQEAHLSARMERYQCELAERKEKTSPKSLTFAKERKT